MPKESRPSLSPKSRFSLVPGPEERDNRQRRHSHQSQVSREEPSSTLAPVTRTDIAGPSQTSFFQSAQNVQSFGGQFSSTQGHHTNLTINFHQYGNESEDPHQTAHRQDVDAASNSSLQVHDIPSNGRDTQVFQPPSGKSSEIYYRHLSTKKRGSPLWVPEPNNMLSVEYQKRGIGIGDVGIITDYGAFDYLFNICPQDNSIDPEDMPEDFSPLYPPLRRADIHGYSAFKAGSHLASAQVETFQQDNESSGLTFESSASEGAILTMPCGSNSTDLRNLFSFRRYAVANAEKWYRYANEVRGREAKNGDIRLVIGYDSTTAWGMATFANLSENRYSRLKFKPIGENDLGRIYGWEYSGITMAEVKSGPDFHEMEKLRVLDQAVGEVVYQNQCLFVRTLNIKLQDDVWNKLAEEWEMFYLGDEDYTSTQHFDHSAAMGKPSPGDKGTGPNDLGGAWDTYMQDDQEMLIDSHEPFQQHSVQILSQLPMALDIHPSQVLNDYLLKERPNAKLAITDDNDWISVIEKEDKLLPSLDVLLERIKKRYDIHEEGDVVFLQLKDRFLTKFPQYACGPLALELGVELEDFPMAGPQDINSKLPTPARERLSSLTSLALTIPLLRTLSRAHDSSALTVLTAPDPMEVFRRTFNWLPLSKLKKGNHQIFKSGVPMWQYSLDEHGGRWALIMKANPIYERAHSSPLALAITGEEVIASPHKQSTKRHLHASQSKLLRVTSVGVIVLQDDNVYKLPWGSW